MNRSDFRFVEIVRKSVTNRGDIKELPAGLMNNDLDYYGKEQIDGYHSAFMFTNDIRTYQESNGSIRGYSGFVYSDFLYWDMDNDDLDRCRQETIELVERIRLYTNNYRIYYSGNKGFHVIVDCPELERFIEETNFNDIVKLICSKLAKDLSSYDEKIYDKTRIFRTNNSKHSETGLYKVSITFEELNGSIERIREIAKEQRKTNHNPVFDNTHNITELLNIQPEERIPTTSSGKFDSSDLLNGIANGFQTGQRNSGLTSVAGMLHANGFDDNFVFAFLTSINNNTSDRLNDEEIRNIVKSISRYKAKEIEIDPSTDKKIFTMKDASESWLKTIINCGNTNFGSRFEHINRRMKMCIPGDVIAIVANSGVGKSSIGMELGNNEAKSQGKYSLMASLEMSKAGVFFRAATIESTNFDEDNYVPSSEVAKELIENRSSITRVIEQWKNLLIIDEGGLGLDQIVDYYYRAQEYTKGRVSNLVIDYAQNIDKAEQIDYAMAMARQFKAIAKQLETKVFVLMQCNKTIPNDYTQVEKNHIEGAGAYFQACDYILGFWRSRDRKNRLHSCFIKDRWNSSDYMFDMVREGLKYHTEDYVEDEQTQSYGNGL